MPDVTQILNAIEQGDPGAAEQLLPLIYDELRKLASARMAQEDPGQTLQATGLVHEAYMRLVDVEKAQTWNSRGHFFGAAAEAMRRILVENARRKLRIRHGGNHVRVELETAKLSTTIPDEELIALEAALGELQATDPMKAKLIDLRFFAGLTTEQAAEILGISSATAKRHWRYARAWLHRAIRPREADHEI